MPFLIELPGLCGAGFASGGQILRCSLFADSVRDNRLQHTAQYTGYIGMQDGFFFRKLHGCDNLLCVINDPADKTWCVKNALICYGILACLKGLKEQGCNGPVTAALDKIEKHLNQAAHEGEEK